MKYFSTSGDRTLVAGEGVQDETDLVRLKISMVVPCASDLALYEGKVPLAKPRIPGHMATAVVSEDREEYGLKLGARVMINPYILSTKDAEGYSKVGVYGLNADGFLRDFIALPIDNIVPFPEDVKEQEALFAEAVSVALAAFNSFRVEKGEYIAVVVGSVLGIIAAQLALYYQAIPILISNDRRYLEIASKCGVYYVIDEAAENTARRVMEITGGRMADHTIVHDKAGVTPNFLFTLAAHGSDCVVMSLNDTMPRLEVDLSLAVQKNLTVKGVSCGCDEFNSAVNLIAQKQLDFSHFIDKVVPFAESGDLFRSLSDNPDQYIAAAIRI